jgi:hypothetical protein
MNDEKAEWDASVLAFRTKATLKEADRAYPYRCVFPARAELIEKLIGEKFPAVACPELDAWLASVGTEKMSVVFAGAYTNNPASLFGHTLLRFQKAGVASGDRSQALLSYSAGFLAATPIEDGQAQMIVKGLFGFYLGFFNVKPYYMSAALYNNSESRDLWEYPLNLRPSEVRWAAMYMWELMHMVGIPYYFADHNCSYRLLTYLEAVRPDLDLTSDASYFVLPIDTIRTMDQAGLVERTGVGFEPSIRRRLEARLAEMTPSQKTEFRHARGDLAVLEKTRDVLVLDALIDEWTIRNYKVQTNLPPKERELFDRTFRLRAGISETGFQPTPESLRPAVAPDRGHRSSWVELQGTGGEQSLVKFQYRLGVHSLAMSSKGYDDFAAIEYFGLDLEQDQRSGQLRKARLLGAEVAALNPWSWDFKEPSWSLGGGLRWEKLPGGSEEAVTEMTGGLGLSFSVFESGLLFFVPQVRGESNLNRSAAFLAPGIRAGFRWEQGSWVSLLDSVSEEVDNRRQTLGSLRVSYLKSVDQSIFVEAQSKERETILREQSLGLGLRVSY